MKKIFILAAMAVMAGTMVTSCKSSKQPIEKGTVEIRIPFTGKEYQADANYFRTSQSGISPDLATAKKIALTNAKTELASNIQTVVKAVTENYSNQRAIVDKKEFENKFEENAILVVNQSLNDVKVIGDKVFKEKNNNYTHYIAIEMSKEILENKIANRILRDSKLQLEFDKQQFKKVFDEEMKKLENQ
jgi:hypothetical protein